MKRKWIALGLVLALFLTGCAPSVSLPVEDAPGVGSPAQTGPVSSPIGTVTSAARPEFPAALDFEDYDGRFALRELLADPDTLAEIFARESAGHGEVVLQIPKFEISDQLDLAPVLDGLGAGIVFDYGQADFSNLSEAALGLSSIRQESTLSIDEKGITAASYTELHYAGAAPPDGRAEIILDRPFLFAVISNGVPLFLGAVNQI